MTPTETAQQLRTFSKEWGRDISNAMRRVIRRARTQALDRGSQLPGVLHAVFEKDRSGLRKLVKTIRVRRSGETFESGLEVKGLAALAENGGRTAAHRIVPKLARLLVWQGPAGLVFAREVRHPGGRVPKTPFVRPQIERSAEAMKVEVETALDALQKRLLG